jgi:hypothetical protein
MYTGHLGAASNRATWSSSVTLTSTVDNSAIDLTGASIELAVGDQQSKAVLLTGSTADGKVAIATPATGGIFTWTFTPDDMAVLADGHYDVGVTVTLANGTVHQLIVSTLVVIDGVVEQ